MSFAGLMSAGTGPGGFRQNFTRGRIGGAAGFGLNYPSPFFDSAHTYLPTTFKQLFRWCRYYFLTNPLINAVVFKLSEYPITDIIIEHSNPEVVKRWTEYYQDHLRYRMFQTEVGLDYYTYGNSMCSLVYPFIKMISCATCDFSAPASKIRAHWSFVNYGFRLNCPKCANIGDAHVKDQYMKNASGIKLLRWNCENIEITDNEINGDRTYFYTIPGPVRNDIVLGKKDIVESTPQIYMQAMKEQKGIVLSKSNFFHMKRPSLAESDRGWGIPLLLPVLKDTFYLQLMKKAQEAILLEHIVPLRILFPQAASGSSDPYTSINLVDWRNHVAQEIMHWRMDNNYIPIMPLPLGNQTIGGDGKALLMTAEIQEWSQHILAGMQVPREFIFGGLSYAGTNVSMRMMENFFIGYILQQRALARFIMKSVASYMQWPEVNIRFKPFKMADDIQRKAYLFQLSQAGKISDTTLLADADLDQEEENKIMERETKSRAEATKSQQLAMAEIQGQQQLVMSKYQAKAQQEMQSAMMQTPAPGEAGGPDALQGGTPGGQEAGDTGGAQQQADQTGVQAASPLSANQQMQGNPSIDIPTAAWQQAQMLANLPPDQLQTALQNLQATSPELATMVTQMLRQMGVDTNGQVGQKPAVDTRPLPEKLPPRRAAAPV